MNRVSILGFLFVLAGIAHADTLHFDRHPAHPHRRLPASVPGNYVLTHNGFFHPSCVYTLRGDEVATTGAIMGLDGTLHERVAPCAYPRFATDGSQVSGGARRPHPGSPPDLGGHFGDYNGWLLFYLGGIDTASTVPAGASLTGTWTVPTAPTNLSDQDLAFFNGLELDAAKTDVIVQPVLDFSEIPNEWGIESESCCFQDNDYQSNLVQVAAGDTISGTIVPTGCNMQTKVCSSYTITTTDLTTGMSTALTTDTHGLVANEVSAAVFETYNVDSCDKLPASGEVDIDNVLMDANGKESTFKYTGDNCINGNCPAGTNGDVSNIPTSCGWGVAASGDTYMLTFGKDPYIVDGGGINFDGSTAPQDAFAGAPEDMSSTVDAAEPPADLATPPHKKHGCATAPLGSAPERSGLLLMAFTCALFLATRRHAS